MKARASGEPAKAADEIPPGRAPLFQRLHMNGDHRALAEAGAQAAFERVTYHDSCYLGRYADVYDEPRAVIEAVGELLEPASTRENALCCGSSVANTAISDGQQVQIARSVAAQLDATGAEVIVTACPLCKKAIGRGTKSEVRDLAEIVVAAIK